MSLRRQSRRERQYQSAKDWPYTPEIDGYQWNPTTEDAAWAAANLNDGDGHTTDNPPEDVLEQMAGEAEAMDRLERGLSL